VFVAAVTSLPSRGVPIRIQTHRLMGGRWAQEPRYAS
jgi:hypothetical protein